MAHSGNNNFYGFREASAGTLWTVHRRASAPILWLEPDMTKRDFPGRTTILFKLDIQKPGTIYVADKNKRQSFPYEKFLYSTNGKIKFGWILQADCEGILIPLYEQIK